jgi:hypothetical protein
MTFTKKYISVTGKGVCPSYCGIVLAILTVLVLTAALPMRGLAQRLGGTLQVEVTDKSGAAVPAAKVTATNEDTKVVSNATSGGDVYVFPDLLPGPYTVEVTKDGFNKYVRAHVNVLPNQTVDAPAILEVGSVSTTVEVTAEGEAPIEVTSSQIQSGFSGAIAEQLPVNTIGGDVKELAVLLPNTTTEPGGVTGSGGSVGGLRPRFNAFTIDGADDSNPNTSGFYTPVIEDSVQDLTVITNQFNAEYGRSAAAIFAVTTKSGTNNFHGEAHEFNRNKHYDAWDNQEQQRGHQDRYDYNRVGASIGGPIFKNRLFFFGAFEYQNEGKASSGPTVNTPTAAGLATLKAAADPGVVTILNQFPTAAAASSTTPVTLPGTTTPVMIPVGTFQGLAPNYTHQHDFIVSLDGNVGNHSIRGRYIYDRQRQPEVNPSEPLPQFNGTNNSDNRKVILNDVWSVSPTLVNQFWFSFSRAVGPQLTVPSGFTNFPNVKIDALSIDIGPNGCSPQTTIENTYQWRDDVTKTFGKHAVKVGFELRNNISPSGFLPRSRGEWDYADLNTFINDALPNGANGALRGAGSAFFAANFKSYYGFAQDDWKITHKLTLNLGLRYEYNTPYRDDALQNLNAISNDPAFGLDFRTPKGAKNNWAPRFGFAYDPFGTGRWSVRGGIGLFYDIIPSNFPDLALPPQLQSEQNPKITCSLVGLAPAWCPSAAGGVGFLQGGGLLTVNVPPATQAAARAATQGFIPDNVDPKILTWSLSVEHQLSTNTTVELRYLGNHAVHLPAQIRLNEFSPLDANTPGGGIAPLPTYLSLAAVPGAVPSPASTLLNFDNFTSPLRLDGFKGNVTAHEPWASSVYHGGSVEVTHRIGHGLTIQGDYTFAHVNDDATNELFTSYVNPRRAQDGYNLRADWGRSAIDIRHKFAFAVVYAFPNVNVSNSFARGFLHGWVLSTTYLAESGQPVTALSDADSNGNGNSAGDRAIFNPNGIGNTGTATDIVCNDGPGGATRIVPASSVDPKLGIPCGVGAAMFTDANVVGYVVQDPKAKYVQAQTGSVSTLGRDTVATRGLNLWNMALLKNISLTERWKLQFRISTFNTFNHPNFSIGLPTNNGTIDQNQNANPFTAAYVFVDSGNLFLNNTVFNGGSRRAELGMKIIF